MKKRTTKMMVWIIAASLAAGLVVMPAAAEETLQEFIEEEFVESVESLEVYEEDASLPGEDIWEITPADQAEAADQADTPDAGETMEQAEDADEVSEPVISAEEITEELSEEITIEEILEEDADIPVEDETSEEDADAEELTGNLPDLVEEEFWDEEYGDGGLYEDANSLLSQYMGLGYGSPYQTIDALFSSYNGDKLKDLSVKIYNELKNLAIDVAAGNQNYTKIAITFSDTELADYSWTAEQLGVSSLYGDETKTTVNSEAAKNAISMILDSNLAVKSLVRDCPYELFWFSNKYTISRKYTPFVRRNSETGEETLGFKSITADIGLGVAEDYMAEAFTTDLTRIRSIQSAMDNARAILAAASGMSDMEKLDYYRQQICSLVSYDYNVSTSTYAGGYGNPWQIIYVFDGDPSTNVVCEGYAKSFQYLCDESSFSSGLYVYCVSGEFRYGSTNGGGHLWNIVHMNAENYLVDLTNADGDTPGKDLFMATPISGSVDEGYTFLNGSVEYTYTYYSDTRAMYDDAELTMTIPHVWDAGKVTRQPTCKERGVITYTCVDCGATREEPYGELAPHTPVTDPAVPATLFATGLTEGQHCSVCNTVLVAQEETPMLELTRFLEPGVEGDDVLQLQQRLVELGYLNTKPNGVYDSATAAAVTAFQIDQGSPNPDGVVWTWSLARLRGESGASGLVLTRALSIGMSGDDVTALQKRLAELGYYSLDADGSFGSITEAAVIDFQNANDLYADGVVGEWTASVLNGSPVPKSQASSGSGSGSGSGTSGGSGNGSGTTLQLTRALSSGMNGDDVAALQKRLAELGYYSLAADGAFGGYTEAAVIDFQQVNQLYADGIVGSITAATLNGNPLPKSGSSSSGSSTGGSGTTLQLTRALSVGMSGDDVAVLQRRLSELGYYSLVADGEFGGYTEAAVQEFQEANGLYKDGIVGEITARVLNNNPIAKTGADSQQQQLLAAYARHEHEAVTDPAVEAGLFHIGLTQGSHCRICGDVLVAQEEIPMRELEESLMIGSNGKDTEEVQEQLYALGYLDLAPDGIYGYYTSEAVTMFQQANGLTADGIVGPYTLAVLQDHPKAYTVETIGPSDIYAIQSRLTQLGFLTSAYDGTFDQATVDALRKFQLYNGIWITGNYDGATISCLNSLSANRFRVLFQGCVGSDVYNVQSALYQLGYAYFPADGIFGPYTEQAVANFQADIGLGYTDGIFGDWSAGQIIYVSEGVNGNNASSQELSVGSQGSAVSALQTALRNLGYLNSVPDGDYGAMTALAVKEFQFYNSIPVSGIADALTRSILYEGYSIPFRSLSLGAEGTDVNLMEKQLYELGYLAERPDDIFNAATEKAVRDFQSKNGFSDPDGIMGFWSISVLLDHPVKVKNPAQTTPDSKDPGAGEMKPDPAEEQEIKEPEESGSGSSGTTDPLRRQIVDYAMKWVGVTPYLSAWDRWTEEGEIFNSLTEGTDCSGFIYLIYQKFGIETSTGSMDYQYSVGEKITKSQLLPGDIIVYQNGGHVAIYAGNNMIIHCANPEAGTVYASMEYDIPTAYVRVIA